LSAPQWQEPACRGTSHVQIGHVQRIFLDEIAARLDDVAHQASEDLVGEVSLGDFDPEQRTVRRVERGLPELVGVHLAEALVALDGKALAAGGEDRLEQLDRPGDARALGGNRRLVFDFGVSLGRFLRTGDGALVAT